MWDRIMWGIEFRNGNETPTLLGGGWGGFNAGVSRYKGEPTRALVFSTRRQARDYCRMKHQEYKDHPICGKWRFRPVRVRETVRREE